MKKRIPEIDAAVLIDRSRAVIAGGEICVLFDVERLAVLHRSLLPGGRVRSAVASPSGAQLALGRLGDDATVWTPATGASLAVPGTLGATPIGWVDEATLVLSAPYGGVIHARLPATVSVAKFHQGELVLDDLDERRLNDTHSACFDQGTVFEVIDGDTLNFYELDASGIRHRAEITPGGKMQVSAVIFVCGPHLALLGTGVAKVLRRSDGAFVADHRLPPGADRWAGDLEHQRLFFRRGHRVGTLDPGEGSWTEQAVPSDVRGISAAGDRLLLQHGRSASTFRLGAGEPAAQLTLSR